MNDRPTHPNDDLTDDELVTAVLDDEATDEQVATVDADPHLSARLASFRTVQAELRAASAEDAAAPGPGAEDRIAAALAAADVGSQDRTTTPRHDRGTLPATRRPVRRRRHLSVLAGAAAAIVLVLAVVGLGIRSASNGADDTAASSASSEGPSQQDAGGADVAEEDGAGTAFKGVGGEIPTTTTASAFDTEQRASAPADDSSSSDAHATSALPHLGEFASTADLLATAADPTRLAVLRSTELACPGLYPAPTIVRVAEASLGGRPVLVVSDDTQARVVDLATCRFDG